MEIVRDSSGDLAGMLGYYRTDGSSIQFRFLGIVSLIERLLYHFSFSVSVP